MRDARDTAIDYGDVQGLVRFGYGHLTESCFVLLRIAEPAAARAWLAAAPVTTAVKGEPPATALNVAFTREGLEALGVPGEVIAGFSPEFVSGMAGDESRSRRLGDVDASAPSGWRWGGPERAPHVIVLLYAKPGLLAGWRQTVQGQWGGAFEVLELLAVADLDFYEPFGFRDGVSQPEIDWDRRRKLDGSDVLAYTNLIALGELLLGYPNEYGKYTDRPLLDANEANDGAAAELPVAEDAAGRRDLGRNGTYLVLRELRQDVRGFWQFLDGQAGGDHQQAQRLGAAMLGRTLQGEPLIPLSNQPIPGVGPDPEDVQYNQFTYASDANGARCPFGAHVRRANPRNADLPDGTRGLFQRLLRTLGFDLPGFRDDLISSSRFHRLWRRGRDFGSGDDDRGLHFIALNANIERQFEFVQNAWVEDTKFGGLTDESDGVLGDRQPIPGGARTDTFSLPREDGVRRRLTGLPQFVTVQGGAYFFLPGMRALHYIASAGR